MTATLRQVVPAAAEGPGWWSRRPWLLLGVLVLCGRWHRATAPDRPPHPRRRRSR